MLGSVWHTCDPKQMSDMSIDLLLITFAISLKAQNGKKKYLINIYGKQVILSTHFVNEVQMSEQLIMHGDYEVLCKFIEDANFYV